MRDQVVGAEEDLPFRVPEHRVRRAVSGSVLDLERTVAEAEELAVVEWPAHIGLGAPRAEAPRDRAQRDHHVLRDPVAEHQVGGEPVVELDVVSEVLHEWDHDVDRRDLGARPCGDDLDQAQVVDVLVRQNHEVEVLERVPERRELALQLVQRLAGVRPGVDEGQGLVLEQVAVDPADGERRRDPQPVDAGVARLLEGLFGGRHERITLSTSSRFASMSSRETSDSRLSRSSGSVLEGRTLKCQSA